MTEPTELMPCPFCGGNARKVKHSAGSPGTIGYDRWHGVACAGCNACVGAQDRRFRTSAAAIAAWNTRTPQPTQAQPVAREPLSDEEVDSLCKVGFVYVIDGKVTRTPTQYRDELKAAQRYGLRKGEHAHGIKGGQHGTE